MVKVYNKQVTAVGHYQCPLLNILLLDNQMNPKTKNVKFTKNLETSIDDTIEEQRGLLAITQELLQPMA